METGFETGRWRRVDVKTRFAIVLVALVAAGIYIRFFSAPRQEQLARTLQQAPASEVVKRLGKPTRELDASSFNALKHTMAENGTPLSNADMMAQGKVWLYKDTTYGYMTVFFDANNCVAKVANTYWLTAP
jgi:hypothetical protein